MKIYWLTAAFIAVSCGSVVAAPINCRAARDDVDQAICAHPELLARDKAISNRLDALKLQCPDAKQDLRQGQNFWLRERSDCRNVEGAFEKPDRLPSCLADRMDQRLRQLNDVGSGCGLKTLNVSYRFVDVDYMQRFSEPYVGKRVSIAGWMDLASCKARRAAPTVGDLVGKDPKRDRFRVKFSAMPEEQRDFLCAQHPFSHWKGVIEQDSEGNYLFLTDVLGQALPNP